MGFQQIFVGKTVEPAAPPGLLSQRPGSLGRHASLKSAPRSCHCQPLQAGGHFHPGAPLCIPAGAISTAFKCQREAADNQFSLQLGPRPGAQGQGSVTACSPSPATACFCNGSGVGVHLRSLTDMLSVVVGDPRAPLGSCDRGYMPAQPEIFTPSDPLQKKLWTLPTLQSQKWWVFPPGCTMGFADLMCAKDSSFLLFLKKLRYN